MKILVLILLARGSDMSWLSPTETVETCHFEAASIPDCWVVSEGERSRGVLRRDGRSLEGREAFLLLRPLLKDANDLASLSMLFLETGVAGQKPIDASLEMTLMYRRRAGNRADVEQVKVDVEKGLLLEVVPEKNSPNSLTAALGLFRDPENVDACRQGISALVTLGDPLGYPMIVQQALLAPAPIVRITAVQALGSMPIPDRILILGQVLKTDARANVRYEAAVQLFRLQDPLSRADLQAALSDSDASVREMAASALKRLGW